MHPFRIRPPQSRSHRTRDRVGGFHLWYRVVAVCVLTLALGACAARSGGGAPAGDRNEITREQIRELQRLDLYEIIVRLRPYWLQTRGIDSFTTSNAVVVYVDGTRFGGPEDLRGIQAIEVNRIVYLDSRQATTRFGAGHPSGAIMVETIRGGAQAAAPSRPQFEARLLVRT